MGIVFSFFGLLGVFILLGFGILTKYFKDSQLLIIGMIVMAISCIILSIPAVTGMSQYQFFLSVALMYSIGYPVGHTALIGEFAKITIAGPQGKLLGWFGSAGSVARILFPMLAGILAEFTNEFIIFGIMAILLIISIIVVYVFKDRLP